MTRFTDKAELACDAHHARWLALATEEVRHRALDRLLSSWAVILADELGERVQDDFGRLEILELALDDLETRVDRELDAPLN
jgi:hypothetical protein